MSYKTNLLLAVSAVAASTMMSTAASATYYCNDGTAVTYKSSCKNYGGCCQTFGPARPDPRVGADGQTKRRALPGRQNDIFDRWGRSNR